MFEKDAEKWWNNEYSPSLYDNVSEVWQKGAEFGYNKGYHDVEEHYMNVIDSQHKLVEESKAKEWHYVKDGDLPNNKRKVWCYYGDDCDKGYYDKDKKVWLIDGHIYCSSIIAWKEIVFPVLSKESE